MSQEIESKVIAAVSAVAFRPVTTEEPLLSSQLIDSIGVVDLVVQLERDFKLSIDIQSVSEKNFNTVNDIVRFVQGKLN